jgi:DNA-binding CsgD family transcriptional regulator
MELQYPLHRRFTSVPAAGLARFPEMAALEGLGVAFALVEAPATLRYVSATAESVYGAPDAESEESEASFWTQFMAALRRAPELPGQATVRILSVTDYCAGSVRAARAPNDLAWKLVVFHPVAYRASCGTRFNRCGLTPREQEVAHLVAEGHATKQIAARLGISFHTARHHTERVFQKLGVRARVEVARMVLLETPPPHADRSERFGGARWPR